MQTFGKRHFCHPALPVDLSLQGRPILIKTMRRLTGPATLVKFLIMITLTSKAAQRINQLQAQEKTPGVLLRLFVSNGGCSGLEYGMQFASPLTDDIVVESAGARLAVAADSVRYLRGSIIDFDDGLLGKGFEIKNPNASSTCGCGKSFQ